MFSLPPRAVLSLGPGLAGDEEASCQTVIFESFDFIVTPSQDE